MKQAMLPDGRVIQFPPDMGDDEIDRAVRAILGVVDPAQEQAAMTREAATAAIFQQLQGIGATMDALTQQMQEAASAINQTAQIIAQKDMQSEIAAQVSQLGEVFDSRIAGLVNSNASLGEAILQSNDELKKAVVLPREVKLPDGRKFVSNVKQ